MVTQRNFYKTVVGSNFNQWFKTTETTQTLVCTNKEMTQNCEPSAFENISNRYWLRGMDLSKYGFAVIDQTYPVLGDINYTFNTPTTISATMCSVTGNENNNAWSDSAVDTHW